MNIRIACVVAALVIAAPVGRDFSRASFGRVDLTAAGASCESLSALTLANGRVTSSAAVAPGAFSPPGATGRGNAPSPYASLPAFCRVTATLTPTSDSDIKIEVWLPSSGWNGEFQAVGNGGWAGTISYPALAAAVGAGYASASTDTGHDTPGATFAMNHPEKLVDYGHRAVHEMTVQAKTMIGAFYGSAPTLSLWNGCSTGGRQGVIEASRYPSDYDAIVAGATPVTSPRLHGARLQLSRMVHRTADSYIPPEKYPAIHEAALQACDALDGVKDGVIDSPNRCKFDPVVLTCKGADGPACLTPAQVETGESICGPVRIRRPARRFHFPCCTPGSSWSGPRSAAPIHSASRWRRFGSWPSTTRTGIR